MALPCDHPATHPGRVSHPSHAPEAAPCARQRPKLVPIALSLLSFKFPPLGLCGRIAGFAEQEFRHGPTGGWIMRASTRGMFPLVVILGLILGLGPQSSALARKNPRISGADDPLLEEGDARPAPEVDGFSGAARSLRLSPGRILGFPLPMILP